ncbi:MAG: hypothetical protein ABSC41_11975 [Acidimicrobiales bacterium]|jgi:hypothetical protein
MDTSSTPRRTVRLILESNRTSDGRIEGRIGPDGADLDDNWMAFSGVLELLKVLEELA